MDVTKKRNHSFNPNSFVDKILTGFRHRRVFNLLRKNQYVPSKTKIMDMGAGKGLLVQRLRKLGYDASGIDVESGNNIISANLNQVLPIESNSIDLVTSLANIEHLEKPEINLSEIYRILKPNGQLILTTPSLAAKPILEFMAYQLKIIEEAEIRDHKFYFTKKTLLQAVKNAGFKDFVISTFQLGLNLCIMAKK